MTRAKLVGAARESGLGFEHNGREDSKFEALVGIQFQTIPFHGNLKLF